MACVFFSGSFLSSSSWLCFSFQASVILVTSASASLNSASFRSNSTLFSRCSFARSPLALCLAFTMSELTGVVPNAA